MGRSGDQSVDLVVGAGPAGLAAALELARSGRKVAVIEKEDGVGGLARSFRHGPFTLDYGPHRFFTMDRGIREMWDRILGDESLTCRRLSRILYRDRYLKYPLDPTDVLRGLGPTEIARVLASFLRERASGAMRPGPRDSFEQCVRAQFGRRLYETFFKGYTEKIWGIPCSDISSDWAFQRIKGLSFLTMARSALLPGGRNRPKTLIDRFSYPRGGIGSFYQKMADETEALGGRILLRTRVEGIAHGAGKITSVVIRGPGGQEEWPVGQLISSMPITSFLRRMSPPPPESVLDAAKSLIFRSTVFVYLVVSGDDLFPDNWIYIHSPETGVGRITNFRNWSPALVAGTRDTPLCMEYWCFEGDSRWETPDDRMVDLAIRELRGLGLAGQRPVLESFVRKVPKTYPVYRVSYKQPLGEIVSYLNTLENAQFAGRSGSFKYNNQDHSILMGIHAARNILGEKWDLWQTNVEEVYGEQGQTSS